MWPASCTLPPCHPDGRLDPLVSCKPNHPKRFHASPLVRWQAERVVPRCMSVQETAIALHGQALWPQGFSQPENRSGADSAPPALGNEASFTSPLSLTRCTFPPITRRTRFSPPPVPVLSVILIFSALSLQLLNSFPWTSSAVQLLITLRLLCCWTLGIHTQLTTAYFYKLSWQHIIF